MVWNMFEVSVIKYEEDGDRGLGDAYVHQVDREIPFLLQDS